MIPATHRRRRNGLAGTPAKVDRAVETVLRRLPPEQEDCLRQRFRINTRRCHRRGVMTEGHRKWAETAALRALWEGTLPDPASLRQLLLAGRSSAARGAARRCPR